MGKERTHIFFAQTVYSQIDVLEIKEIIKNNLSWYYFGCISPDIFYYSKDPKLEHISNCLHGRSEFLTNEVIFDLAKDCNSDDVRAFIMGYLTHCVFDMNIHPIINAFVGNYRDSIDAKAKHRQIETELDLFLSPEDVLNILPNYIYEDFLFIKWLNLRFNLKYFQFKASYARMLKLMKLFKSRTAYKFAKIFIRDKSILSLFYGSVQRKCTKQNLMSEIQLYNKEFPDNIIKIAVDETCSRIVKVNELILGRISVAEARNIIKAENLDTGVL